jgi:outer membrane protein
MRQRNVLFILNFLLIAALAIYMVLQQRDYGKAYVLNQRVFDEYKGKLELEKKLSEIRMSNKKVLDSLTQMIAHGGNTEKIVDQYQARLTTFAQQERELSERFTADIWKRINEEMIMFGKKEKYDFIFGASGDGSLMYANEGYDITDKVIEYLNKQYDDGLRKQDN